MEDNILTAAHHEYITYIVFADSASKIGKYCGSNADGGDLPARRTYSAGNTLYVRFVTDATNQRTGFQFTFRIVGELSLQGTQYLLHLAIYCQSYHVDLQCKLYRRLYCSGVDHHKPSCDVSVWTLSMIIGIGVLIAVSLLIACTVITCCVKYKSRIKS